METILLEQNNASFVCNAEKNRNFFTLDYIAISSYVSSYNENNCEALISFNLGLLECTDIMIHSAKLIIPLEIFKINFYSSSEEIKVFYNTEDPSYETLTWNTRPSSAFYSSVVLGKSDIKNKCIIIDITSLLCDWMYNDLANYGLTLITESPNLMIILPKYKIRYSPKLLINYTCRDYKSLKTSALFVQCTDKQNALIKYNEPFIMNNIVTLSKKGIVYDTETGIITISRKGFYCFSFTLNINGTSEENNLSDMPASIGIKNLKSNSIISFNNSEVFPKESSASCVIEVTENNEEFILFNNSKQVLQLSFMDVQASLTVFNV